MPNTSGINASSKASLTTKIKRCVIAATIAVAAIVALDPLGLSASSLAQRAGRNPGRVELSRSAGGDCSYLKAPENYRGVQARHREAISRTTEALTGNSAEAGLSLIEAAEVPRKNVIDDIVFGRMQRDGIASAPLCTDEEYIRRVSLDLTGRIPSPNDVTAFIQDQNPSKRDALVDRLIGSPEYVDKWTMFFGDLFKNTPFPTNIPIYIGGRDAYYNYIKSSIAENKDYGKMA